MMKEIKNVLGVIFPPFTELTIFAIAYSFVFSVFIGFLLNSRPNIFNGIVDYIEFALQERDFVVILVTWFAIPIVAIAF